MTFLKYIFELIVILYAVRFVMRLIDSTFANKPIANNRTSGETVVQPTQSASATKPKGRDEDYIEYEEIK